MIGEPLRGWHGFITALKGAMLGRRTIYSLCDATLPKDPIGDIAYRVAEEICERYLCVPRAELHRGLDTYPGKAHEITYWDAFLQEKNPPGYGPLSEDAAAEIADPEKPYLVIRVNRWGKRIQSFYMTGEAARRLEARIPKVPEEEAEDRRRITKWGFFVEVENMAGATYTWDLSCPTPESSEAIPK